MFKKANGKAAASEHPRRTPPGTSRGSERCENAAVGPFQHPVNAEVVEWQTRTFEGRVAQAVRVQVPPSAPSQCARSRALGFSGFGRVDLDFSLAPVGH